MEQQQRVAYPISIRLRELLQSAVVMSQERGKMSTDADDDFVAEARMTCCCASCGIAEVDDEKLTKCDGCDLVRYCSDACQEDHRPEHEAECKERAAELRDEILFRQPEGSHMGDCPICCLPLSIDLKQSSMYPCCCKVICKGCSLANKLRQFRENMPHICPFCRHPRPGTDEEAYNNLMKRVEANDPAALFQVAKQYLFHNGDNDGAFKYLTKAAELGNADAHLNLSHMYRDGSSGVEKDETKELYHLEEAAIRGHACARHNLGVYEGRNGRDGRALKHFTIAASLGFDRSLKGLKDCYKNGMVSKDDFAAALRAHHAAVKATKSPQRDQAKNYMPDLPIVLK